MVMDLFLANRPFVSSLQSPQAHGFIVTRVSLSRLQRGQSKKFRISVEKLPGSRRGIGAMSEQDFRHGDSNGGNHADCRISSCDCTDHLNCVGRVGAANAGKLSRANLPFMVVTFQFLCAAPT